MVVNSGGSAVLFPANFDDAALFCCSEFNVSTDTCTVGTKGSTAPFSLEAGLVIYNRTSGSTSPNITNAVTRTVTATATSSASAYASSSSSSGQEAAIGAGIGVPLGLALVVALALLLKQRGHKQILTKDVQIWKGKYEELKNTKAIENGGPGHQPRQQLVSQRLGELEGHQHHPQQLQGWTPSEIEGTQLEQ